MVSVCVCAASFQVPAWRISYSLRNISAPVGQTPIQLPQYTHAESVSGTANSVAQPMQQFLLADRPDAAGHTLTTGLVTKEGRNAKQNSLQIDAIVKDHH